MLTTIIIFILVLMVLVLAHEWGHFFAARKNGIRVDEFGFGFPPRLGGVLVLNRLPTAPAHLPKRKYRFIIGNKEATLFVPEENYAVGTLYSLNLLPLGGFVKIKGENSVDGNASDPDSFSVKKTWQKALVLTAGVGMNVLVGWLLITIGMIAGLPQDVGHLSDVRHVIDRKIEITQVISGKPADTVGLKPGDAIIEIGGIDRPRLSELQDFVDKNQGKPVLLGIERPGEEMVFQRTAIPLFNSSTGKGGLGIGIIETGIMRYPWYQALYKGFITTFQVIGGIFAGFGSLITSLFAGESVGQAVSGPVGVAKMTGEVARLGFIYLLQFMALLSLNLAVLNILPVPALDGGRLLFVLISAVIRRPVTPKYEQIAHTIGFLLLMALVLVATVHDLNISALIARIWP